MRFSVVTPVYNRREKVLDSIRSSLHFLAESGIDGEVIIVDDGSTDGTFQHLADVFDDQIGAGLINLIRCDENKGVSAAKQRGVNSASGDWLFFMDSDDVFVGGCGEKTVEVLSSAALDCPIVFFRCINQVTGQLIGPRLDSPVVMPLSTFLKEGTPGECLPVVRRDAIIKIPYEEDLRGFESITWARIIREFGDARVELIVARAYCDDDVGDRLSTRSAIRLRGCQLARGYLRLLSSFWDVLGIKGSFSIAARVAYHGINCCWVRSHHIIEHILRK